ncbi:MAG TPA: serine/threonine-protein kinase [Candidatus Acidoferrales bacterium]|nr:serine/threonine-protein kinase [Candidatus Acidoferrales bacterium]
MTQEIVGTRKGDYEVLALLGVGGMGQVYKVRNVLSDRIEAMKVLLPNLGDQKMLADRFIREIKVLAGLHHPNIAELRTALTIDNQLVMIMEFVEGTTLAARIQEGGLPYGRSLGYIQQVLSALSYAHSQKIIHRDIKPANMMLTPKGVVKLMDFGIARQDGDVAITSTNSTVGSIAYMSPEQVKGEHVDPRSDLYSVGVSLYELITGQRPFVGDTGFSIMRAHLETMPKPPIELRPDLPAAISDLILMSVAKDPGKRFQSADAFSRAIASVFPDAATTVPVATVAPVADPTVMLPPAFGETSVAAGNATSFQATQFTAAATPQASAAAASSARAATPVPSKVQAPPPAAVHQNSYRGFYIALGALIVLFAMVAAGFYLPRHLKTQAAQQANASQDSEVAPASASSPSESKESSSAAQPAASTSDSANNSSPAPSSSSNTPADTSSGSAALSSASNSEPAASSHAASSSNASTSPPQHINVPPRNGAGQQSSASSAPAQTIYVPPRTNSAQSTATSAPVTAPATAQDGAQTQTATAAASASAPVSSGAPAQANAPSNPGANSAPAPASAASLQQAETQLDQVSSRATAVTASLDGMRKQQAAQGLSLRGDMTAAEQRMEANLSKAENALQAHDPAQAKHYMDLAEPDVEKLETFLGH